MRKASTRTGLRTTVNVIRRHYETGRKATDHVKQNLKIVFDTYYQNGTIVPSHNMRQ